MKSIDIDASNVVGLGASIFSSNIINTIHSSRLIEINKIFVPPSSTSLFHINIELTPRLYHLRDLLFRRASRILRLLLPPKTFLASNLPLLVLGDVPYRLNRRQLVLLHNPHLMRCFSWKQFSLSEIYYAIARVIFSFNCNYASYILVQSDRAIYQVHNVYPSLPCPVKKLPILPLIQLNDYLANKTLMPTFPRSDKLRLFYPASPYPHKNHSILLSLQKSKLKSIENIILTVNASDFPNLSSRIFDFVGTLSYQQTLEYFSYNTDALLFLSLEETLGLPLIEAMYFSLPIICPDRDYAKDLCGPEAIYFDPLSSSSLECAITDLHAKLCSGWSPDWTPALKKIRTEFNMFIPTIKNLL